MLKNPYNIDINWKYRIVDDVIDSSTSEFVYDMFKQAPLDYFDNKQIYGIEYQIPCWDFNYLTDFFDDLINESEISVKRKKQRTWFPRLSLTVHPPHTYYPWHFDSDFKLVSGVVYWGNMDKGGTLLANWNNNESRAVKDVPPPTEYAEVGWKHNRGLFFCSAPGRTWHAYKNPTDRYRYTVGVHLYDVHELADALKYGKDKYRGHHTWKMLGSSKENYWRRGGPNTLEELNSWM